jgi:two-component system, chemotaxis family, response regulator WspR
LTDTDRPTVLIIDDARASREALVTMVEALGYGAVASDNPLEGLRLVAEINASLVLLDVVMPTFDGFKIAAAIKAQPRFVPVILLTALNDVESKRRGQAAGADDFLSKPVAALELSIRIAAMLRIKSLTDALDAANRRLAELADVDGLTNIANRRRIEEKLRAEYERARRYRRWMALCLLDVDHFKSVNDTHGHAVGDAVLRTVAGVLASTIRQTDHVGRWGGEEFALVAPELDPTGLQVLGDRLRVRVEQATVAAAASVGATISVGAVAWNGRGETNVEALLKHADEALYEAKAAGRNRVVRRTLGE